MCLSTWTTRAPLPRFDTVRVRPFLVTQTPLTEDQVTRLAQQHGLDIDARSIEDDAAARLERWQWEELLRVTGFTLPSEAQWEYACRAGATTLFPFGDSLPGLPVAPLSDIRLAQAMLNRFGDEEDVEAAANTFGLAGMLAGEWCADTYVHGYEHASGNDIPVINGSPFVIRGGAAWVHPWQNCGEWVGAICAMRWSSDQVEAEASCHFVRRLPSG